MLEVISIVLGFITLLFFVFEIGYWLGRAQGVRDMRSPTKYALDGG